MKLGMSKHKKAIREVRNKYAPTTPATDAMFIESTTVVRLTGQKRGCMQDTCAAVLKYACQYMTCRTLPGQNLNHG